MNSQFILRSLISSRKPIHHHHHHVPFSTRPPAKPPSPEKYAQMLIACTNNGDTLRQAKSIHTEILKHGIKQDTFLINQLLSAYAKSGRIEDARQVFDRMPDRNTVSWSVIAAAYTHGNRPIEALRLFTMMGSSGTNPNPHTYSIALRACGDCGISRDFALLGFGIHAQVYKMGLGKDVYIRTGLLTMYSKQSTIDDANRIFEETPDRDVGFWNARISANVGHCDSQDVLIVFSQMQKEFIMPDKFTLSTLLSVCADMRGVTYGRIIHCLIIKLGFEYNQLMVSNSLINFYGKCYVLDDARQVFDEMSEKTHVTWNSMISAYVQNDRGEDALKLLLEMKMKPNGVIFASIARALKDLHCGEQVHARVIGLGLMEDLNVCNALISMYFGFRSPDKACRVFEMMCGRDKISWNSMVSGFADMEDGISAIRTFHRGLRADIMNPDKFSLTSVLSGCGRVRALIQAAEIHCYVLKGRVGWEVAIWNAIITAYSECRVVRDALKVFSMMGKKEDTSWNAIITGCSQQGFHEEAFRLFARMICQGFRPNEVTFTVLLCACSGLAALGQGKKIHAHVIKTGLEGPVTIGSSLVTMYERSGAMEDGIRIFKSIRKHNVVSLSSMIAGYAHHGYWREALTLFKDMQKANIKPNSITFIGVLSACSNAGLVEKGIQYYEAMFRDHGIVPTLEHYACIVDMLGRVGHLEKARDFILNVHLDHGTKLWSILLGACKIHGNVELAKYASKRIAKVRPNDSATYVMMSNVFAAAGKWEEVARLRKEMRKKGLKREPGFSWLEIGNQVHSFHVGDVSHPQNERISKQLNELMQEVKAAGYVPEFENEMHDLDEKQKQEQLSYHGEKLALSFGLISTPAGATLRILKNIRVCGDCHTFFKLVSERVSREIVLRDTSRFHHFKDGCCSCGDFW